MVGDKPEEGILGVAELFQGRQEATNLMVQMGHQAIVACQQAPLIVGLEAPFFTINARHGIHQLLPIA